MSLVSLGFLLFLLAGAAIYYCLPHRFQWMWLLILSYFYYFCSGPKTMVYIMLTTLSVFGAALYIEKQERLGKEILSRHKGEWSAEEKKRQKHLTRRKKRLAVWLVLLLNFGILAVLKYFAFALDNVANLFFDIVGIDAFIEDGSIKILMPLGISFYTFQSVGYVIDVYQGKIGAEHNVFKFALFVSFFPQILQGPIGRFQRLSAQFFERHTFSLVRIQYGLQLMFWGFFKKMVLADRAGAACNEIFNHPGQYSGLPVIAGVLCYCLQLYGDFSGGMDVVMGSAELFGIKLDQNFRQPFFSKSIAEFWRRWHITLGTWMKDYIFYPFSLSKYMNRFTKFCKRHLKGHTAKVLPICIGNLLVFFVVGIWHGAAWKFIVYGLYNGLIIAVSSLLEPLYDRLFSLTHINRKAAWWTIVQIVRTFALVNIGWYFDRGNSLGEAFTLMYQSVAGFRFSALTDGSLYCLGLGRLDFMILALGVAVWFVISVLKEKGIHIRDAVTAKPTPVKWAIYLALVVSIPFLGYVSEATGGFLYAQF